jgi:hypothetical protein
MAILSYASVAEALFSGDAMSHVRTAAYPIVPAAGQLFFRVDQLIVEAALHPPPAAWHRVQ